MGKIYIDLVVIKAVSTGINGRNRHFQCMLKGAKETHQTQFPQENFIIAVVKKVSPQRLWREEYRLMDKFQTNTLGLNIDSNKI